MMGNRKGTKKNAATEALEDIAVREEGSDSRREELGRVGYVETGRKGGNPYLGVGLYSTADAARLIGVRGQKLRRWRQGYTFGQKGVSRPLFGDDYPELARRRILTLADLVELKLISLFRDAGVSMRKIRRVAEWAAEKYSTNHPFAMKQFKTDGKRIFVEMEEREERERAGRKPRRHHQEAPEGQVVFDAIAVPFFKRLDYAGEEVQRYWPLGKDKRVVLDATRSFGKPIDHEFGVPTLVLYSAFRAGESIESVADWYDVSVEAVEAAIEYEQSLAA
jgi:uncharacterized protein (DUF433 family)/DNA-binding transcriptional MerR regulator